MTRLDGLVGPWAGRAPDHPAVEGAESLTYAQLDALANRFARSFLASGVRHGDRIGIHLPRSGRGIAAMLGALRAGAVYVPLDPGSPPVRIGLIARDCRLKHAVVAPGLVAGWLAQGARELVEHFFLSGDGSSPEVSAPTRIHPWSDVLAADASPVASRDEGGDELAYILYTSGSTGVPKGVMLSHRNALAFIDWATDLIELSQADRVASVAPFHFDLSVFDVWGSLSRGATVVIVDEAAVASGRRMLDRICAGRITVWYSVPSALVLMLESGGLAERGAPSLRTVFFAGEVFPMRHLARAMAAIPQARFFNLFGPTETNVCAAYEVSSPPPPGASAIPIGRASCGDALSILDPTGQLVRDGETGELHVDGPTVMLGYWDGGRCTAAPRPYPTGDLVSRRSDGELLYHGRRDHLVKIHGFRVELGEVEAALVGHPGVQEAVAFAADQRLVAVVLASDASLPVLEIKRWCAARLPRYMIPSEVRLVAELPRTSSGKIDRVRTTAAVLGGDTSLPTAM